MKGGRITCLALAAGILGTAGLAPARAQTPDSGRPRVRATPVTSGGGATRARTAIRQKPTTYRVFAIRYGTTPDVPTRNFVPDADSTRRMDLSFMVWLLRGSDGRDVLVDAGFYQPREVAQWRVADFVLPSRAVARAGVAPEEVSDLILTHAHFDHDGGMDLFPRARIWIQREEYDSATAGPGRRGEAGMTQAAAAELVRFRQQGRVQLIDGESEILPGIRVFPRGGHTWGSQYLAVATRAGTVVIASDNVATYENLARHRPNPLAVDTIANLRAQEQMLKLAARPELVVPGHDPDVFRRFPKPGNGIARID